ncbi:MAG: GNAT family N-acetyltransferase [Pseudomonadota bacterium]|nr:GNAT family N-acetyltransferase [Pseudomonadota bacterium]
MSAIAPPPLDDAWLARIEDAGINASAPREQRWVDGWLLRLCPGKAKRARCIQAVAPGRFGVDDKLAVCLPLFAAAGLRPYVRITPFSEPPGLDRHLAGLGMVKVDDTRVMAIASLDGFASEDAVTKDGAIAAALIEPAAPADFAEWVGCARGSSVEERRAHADRIARPAVPHHAVLARDARGDVVAAGQLVIEGKIAGLYDVFTAEAARGRGHAERVCRHLLAVAARRGASVGYLQVDAGNEAARRIYRRLGFADGYSYHYRTPAEGAA